MTAQIKFIGREKPIVKIEGASVKARRNSYGHSVYDITSNADKVTVRAELVLYERSKFWLPLSIFFFIISLFGLFDRRVNRACLKLNLVFTVENGTRATVNMLPYVANGNDAAAFTAESGRLEVFENSYEVDETAKKRRKTGRLVKVLVAIALGVVLAVVIARGIAVGF